MLFSLHEFTIAVPSCVQTTKIAAVLEIFAQKQCTSVVVVDEEQHPLGVLELVELMPLLLKHGLNVRRNSRRVVDTGLIKPIITLAKDLSREQLELELRSLQTQKNLNCNWVVVDSVGRYIGLVDSQRVWEFLALNNTSPASFHECAMPKAVCVYEVCAPRIATIAQQPELDLLLQILEQLPWPLILQPESGEVVLQNSAWSKYFHEISDPEQVGREVAAILHSHTPQAASATGNSNKLFLEATHITSNNAASNCQLSEQGNCICVWSLPNSHQRVWEFTKVPLQGLEVIATQNTGVKIQNSGESGYTLTPKLWLVVANDVTQQQQLASELAAKNADLIQLNRLKDEFLACISHELKTPLTAVLGLSTLLKDQALGQLNERQSRYARLIHQSGRHLMSVVNDNFRFDPDRNRTVKANLRAGEDCHSLRSRT